MPEYLCAKLHTAMLPLDLGGSTSSAIKQHKGRQSGLAYILNLYLRV